MKNKMFYRVYILLFLIFSTGNQLKAQQAFGPVPSENQMRWQEMEYYAFVHLSVNTYTDMAWGFGNEDPKIFNPTNLDCRQWARIAKEAGMKGIILTAKHHSGFCLWPSKYTEYSVKNSPWKNGKGDIVREMADACKEYGLKLGIYLSPWDRNHLDYGKPEYITYFRNQLKELLTNYGEIFEVWFDGANGGDGYYGGANETRRINRETYYDWANTYKLVRELQPKIVIWNDNGDRADLRWVGTEAGYVGKTNWSLLNATGKVTENMLSHGVEDGNSWVPGEVNTSIRPEWFYHKREDSKVKTLPDLMTIYYNSIGRNGTLLLNFPIMPNGLIHQKDEKAVLDFAQEVKKVFAVNLTEKATAEASGILENNANFGADKSIDRDTETYWTTDDQAKSASLIISFDKPTAFNRFLVQEYIKLGQRVKSFKLEANINGEWKELATETTIGYKRILCFPTVEATKLRFTILDTKKGALISNIGIYNAPQILTAPQIIRKQSGAVAIILSDAESEIYYTLDGSTPTFKSKKYTNEVATSGSKVEVKAIAYNPITAKSSAVAEEKFDIARKNWKILSSNDAKAYEIIDGDFGSVWYQDKNTSADVVIDLGKIENLVGFRYLPDQNLRSKGIVTKYQFYVSLDNKKWELVNEGEFSNINNNPLWQNKIFKLAKARYIKFTALENTKGDNVAGFAEIDVMTK
ncbi:alpha-L-fucosidase [Flavobacterium glycines]|uniref:alpha-L-fucosidase n=2 Tax=Flavobacterium glycines TaxID=551990 RepID=A0A1G8PX98_9FLAO|nr:alpha-L-fucosidase [Flavobacterium glycines]SDI97179.1 alpha-L-fucosidase [Flavobacterium glycines]